MVERKVSRQKISEFVKVDKDFGYFSPQDTIPSITMPGRRWLYFISYLLGIFNILHYTFAVIPIKVNHFLFINFFFLSFLINGSTITLRGSILFYNRSLLLKLPLIKNVGCIVPHNLCGRSYCHYKKISCKFISFNFSNVVPEYVRLCKATQYI